MIIESSKVTFQVEDGTQHEFYPGVARSSTGTSVGS